MSPPRSPQAPAGGGEPGAHRRPLVLATLCLCMVIAVMDTTILSVALVPVQKQLGATHAQLQWTTDAYTLAFAALLFAAGLLGDRLGRRRVLVAGLLLLAAASALGAWSDSLGELILWRAVTGAGASVLPVGTMAVISQLYREEERAGAVSAWTAAQAAAVAAGPVLGGALASSFWWGSTLLVNVPLALGAAWLVHTLVPESRDPHPGRFDAAGVLLATAGAGALLYGVIAAGGEGSWWRPGVAGPVVAGAVLLGLFVAAERRAAAPALDLRLFAHRPYAVGTLVVALSFLAVQGGSFVLVFYIQDLRGFTALQAGLTLLPVALGTLAAAAAGAPMARRFGTARVVTGGMLVMAACFVFYAGLDAGTPVALLDFVHGCFGAGFGLVLTPATAAAMAAVPAARAGAGSAASLTLRQFGTALGIAVIGSVLAVGYRAHMRPAGAAVPEALRERATGSLGGALEVAPLLPGGGAAELLDRARSAFGSGLGAAMTVAAAASVCGAVAAFAGLRERRRPEPAVRRTGGAPVEGPTGAGQSRQGRRAGTSAPPVGEPATPGADPRQRPTPSPAPEPGAPAPGPESRQQPAPHPAPSPQLAPERLTPAPGPEPRPRPTPGPAASPQSAAESAAPEPVPPEPVPPEGGRRPDGAVGRVTG